MDLGLAGKKVIINGGAQGLGLASLRIFAAEGADVAFLSRDAGKVEAAVAGMVPRKRMAQLDEVSALVAFLASDEAAFISGSDYAIDGAITAGMMGV
ncbi:SDR family oxidoreductase [Sphingopyxis sp. DBS4]|uniref:SDR family oxidoreductase n=1 Tax=Sphingopyxis sp. DBS4 TaxID=2968500 RepID=UPI00214C9A9D|nr:SDR family oxidoreductase [Sphingopyxis sp. DBS4]